MLDTQEALMLSVLNEIKFSAQGKSRNHEYLAKNTH